MWGSYLFKSKVESSRTSSRKQKTGYCRPSSLNRSTFTLCLIFLRKAVIHPIFVALAAFERAAYTISLQKQR